jgi:hypothetical protein
MNVPMDEFWMDDRIYWTLWYSVWLYFKVHCYTYQCPQLRFHYRCLVAAFNGRRSPSSRFQNNPRPQLTDSHSNI